MGGRPGDATADLAYILTFVERRVQDALAIVDTPYGPRLWITFRKTKHAAQLLRQTLNEVRLIESTSIPLAERRASSGYLAVCNCPRLNTPHTHDPLTGVPVPT